MMSDHSTSKDSFSQNFLAAAAAAATTASQQANHPNAAQLLQHVLNNPMLQQQQQQPTHHQPLMNSNAMATFFANSLAAFQAVQQHQQQSINTGNFHGFDPSALLNHMMSSVSAPQQILHSPSGVIATAEPTATLPTYVNPKQFKRIIKRREARRVMDEYFARKRKQREEKKPYMHESRHKHAMKRPRGPGGRFLTKDELEDLKNNSKPIDEEGFDSYKGDAKMIDPEIQDGYQANTKGMDDELSGSSEVSAKKLKIL